MLLICSAHLPCILLLQYKPIQVTRFVIAGSIEERILKLQEKKQAVFEGTVGRDTQALARLTEDDLRFLFS
jgi:DNA repair protein RAD16